MAILLDQHSRLLMVGITGRQARVHVRYHLDCGARLVCGVTPGKGGESVEGVPVYDSVRKAQSVHGPLDAALILVPPMAVADAASEVMENGIPLMVIITEHVPVHDILHVLHHAKACGCQVVGPNTIGIISPGRSKLGVMPAFLYREGPVGIVSRSGTLTHEVASCLSVRGIGQSTCVGIGGDALNGSDFVAMLELFRADPDTRCVVLIGEIGGSREERAAAYLREQAYPKPVFAFIAGSHAPKHTTMGHAGAIMSDESGNASVKKTRLRAAGVTVCDTLEELYEAVAESLTNGQSTLDDRHAFDALRIHEADPVAIALTPLEPGQEARIKSGSAYFTLRVAESIPYGHKLALGPLDEGEVVTKYGEAIGTMRTHAAAGTHIHIHNMRDCIKGESRA